MYNFVYFLKGLYGNSIIAQILFANIFYFLYIYNQKGIWIILASIFLLAGLLKLKRVYELIIILFLSIVSFVYFSNFIVFDNQNRYEKKYFSIDGYVKNYDGKKLELILTTIDSKRINKSLSIDISNINIKNANYRELSYIRITGGLYIERYKGDQLIVHLNNNAKVIYRENVISSLAFLIKERIAYVSDYYFKDKSSLAKAMIFGIRDDISSDQNKLYRDIGLSHVLVASGANILIIVSIIEFLASKIKLVRYKNIFLIIVIFLYLAVVGIEGSIVRACFFFLIDLVPKYIGREVDYLQKIQLTIIMMIIILPSLVVSLSFILSLLACISIKFSSDLIRTYSIKNRFIQSLVQNFVIVVLVNILIAYSFHTLNLNGFISNILLLFLVEIIVIYGFSFVVVSAAGGLLIGDYFAFISNFFSIPINFLFLIFIKVSEYLQNNLKDMFIFKYYISTEYILIMYTIILVMWILIQYKKYINLDLNRIELFKLKNFTFFREA